MTKIMFALGTAALALAAPAFANSHIEKGSALPKCSATVKDSCDQSMTTEKNAMTAEQAMKSGGVGDRKTGDTAMMSPKPMMAHKKPMMHRKMVKSTAAVTTTTADAPK